MLSPKVESMLNDQIHREFFSAYLYLSMSTYLSSTTLNGYAHWFMVQAQEERDHALIMLNYMVKAGGRVRLQALEQPTVDFSSVEEVLAATLAHEQFITKSIYDLVDAASQEKDFKTAQMLNWFVNEQVEEEGNATDNLGRYGLMGTDGKGLYMLDQAMAARAYAAPAILTAG